MIPRYDAIDVRTGGWPPKGAEYDWKVKKREQIQVLSGESGSRFVRCWVELGFPDIHFYRIRLGCAGCAAASGDDLFQQLGEPGDYSGMRGLHVVRFADVGVEIVELDRRQILRLFAAGLGLAPATGVRAEFQFPFALPDRE